MVTAVYVALSAAIWLGAQPWRLRDAIEWVQRVPGRARITGGALAAYGLLLAGVAFTY
jgi:UDP-N-acetylmuramyl tripeptide synthase